MTEFFSDVAPIRYEGPEAQDDLAYRFYDPARIVLGKRMDEQLRIAVCYWHSFNWPGSDVFGAGTLDRPWLDGSMDPMDAARMKMDAAFEFFANSAHRSGASTTSTSRPRAPPSPRPSRTSKTMVAYAEEKMAETGVKLLWGTANLFSHPRYAAGAATNPDPEVFSYAAAQVKNAIDATHQLGGANYVLWGGREGYETLLNTKISKETDQLARFLHMVVDYKRSIGFEGKLLLEPKPQEPTKHQYDYDSATVHGFLERYDLLGEYFVNIEANHATLAGPQLPPRGRLRRGEWHLREHRCQSWRSPERLGHRPVSRIPSRT